MRKENNPPKNISGKKGRKTTLIISVVTCLFMCTMGYEISKSSSKKFLEASDQVQKHLVLYTNAPEVNPLDDYQLKIKFLTTQTQLQSQKILELKQEIQSLNEQIHELRLITFPKKETIAKTFEMKKALEVKEFELTKLQKDYHEARTYLLNMEKDNAKLAKQLSRQKKKIDSSYSQLYNFTDEIASLYDTVGALIDHNKLNQEKQLRAYNEWEAQAGVIQTLAERLAEKDKDEKELYVQKKLNNSLNQSIQKQQLRLALNHLQNSYWKTFTHEHRRNLKQALIEAQESLDNEKMAYRELLEELSYLAKVYEDQNAELLNLKNENFDKEQRLSELTRHLTEKEASLNDLESNYQKIFDQLALTQEEMQNADRSVNIAKTQVKELDYINMSLKRQLEDLAKKGGEDKEDLLQLSAYGDDITNAFFFKNRQQAEEAEKLQNEIAKLENALMFYHEELMISQYFLTQKESDLAHHAAYIDQLEQNVREHQGRILDQEISLSNLNQRQSELEAKYELINQLLIQNKSYTDELQSNYESVKNDLDKNRLDLANAKDLYDETIAKLNLLEEDLGEKEKHFAEENNHLKHAFAELEQKNSDITSQLIIKEEQLSKLEAEIKELAEFNQYEQNSLSGNLETAMQKINTLQFELQTKDQLLSETNEQLFSLSNKLNELNKAHIASATQHDSLQETHRQLVSQKESLLSSQKEWENQQLALFEALALNELLLQQTKKNLSLNKNQYEDKLMVIKALEDSLISKGEELLTKQEQYNSKEFDLLARQQLLQEDLLKYKTKLSDLEYQISQKENYSQPSPLSYEYLKNQFHTTIESFKSQLEEERKRSIALEEELQKSKNQVDIEKKRVIEIQEEFGSLLKDLKQERVEHEKMMKDLVSELERQAQTLQANKESKINQEKDNTP